MLIALKLAPKHSPAAAKPTGCHASAPFHLSNRKFSIPFRNADVMESAEALEIALQFDDSYGGRARDSRGVRWDASRRSGVRQPSASSARTVSSNSSRSELSDRNLRVVQQPQIKTMRQVCKKRGGEPCSKRMQERCRGGGCH
eukprot:1033441-Pleurochrysis_carterae.AAC.1